MNSHAKLIEALLFYKGEPVSKKDLMKSLGLSAAEADKALDELREHLSGHGIVLIENDETYALATSSEASELLEALRKEELSKELSKASVETLAIIAYTGETTRAEIDYIRGVNSSFILRALLIRGLVEKFPNPKDARTFVYKPSMDLLAFMGASNPKEFPEYEHFHTEIMKLLKNEGGQDPEKAAEAKEEAPVLEEETEELADTDESEDEES